MKQTKFKLVKIEQDMKELNEIADKHEIVKWEQTGSKTILGQQLILVEYRV